MKSRLSNIEKENLPPVKKQGILYSIKTNKNNGVYLPKDITHNNYKSLTLLTLQARQAHKSYVDTLESNFKQAQKSPQKTKNLSDVQSFNHTYEFSLKTLKKIHQYSQQCGQSIKVLRNGLNSLKQNITTQTTQLQTASVPALKNLREKLKNGKSEQGAIVSKMKRQLQQIKNNFRVVGNGVKQCNRRIQTSSYTFGGEQQMQF